VTAAEVTDFLERPLLGVVSTLMADGSPHQVPVWYRWDGERIHIWTHDERLWVRNVLRDPRVAFSVQEPAPPFAAVAMRGQAEVDHDDPDEIRRITGRYIEPAEVEEYVSAWPGLRTLVRIRPAHLRGWARGY
jgi:PPOX class probable F420-dependent enzyme